MGLVEVLVVQGLFGLVLEFHFFRVCLDLVWGLTSLGFGSKVSFVLGFVYGMFGFGFRLDFFRVCLGRA